MPVTPRERFIARVLRRQGLSDGSTGLVVAGVGFAVGIRRIATCAHVVNTALGREDMRAQQGPRPDELVEVDFPIVAQGPGPLVTWRCRVVAWVPPADGVADGDVAGLELIEGSFPDGVGPARLMDPMAVRGQRVAVFGYPQYPEVRTKGLWREPRLSGGVGGGAIQLDGDDGEVIQVQPGYSGSPVVATDSAGDAVVGILSAADEFGSTADSYAISVRTLVQNWPGAELTLSTRQIGYTADSYGPVAPSWSAGGPVLEMPAAPASFVGRSAEIERICAWLRPRSDADRYSAPRVAGLYGMPGSGKTALGLQVAHELRAEFPDFQFYFALRSSDRSPVSVETLLERKLTRLGLPGEMPSGLEARAEAFRSVAALRRSLLLIDNVTGKEQVLPLLPNSADMAVIVTSRSRIPGLGHEQQIDPLNDADAAELLAAISGRSATEADEGALREAARLLGNLPLALEIAGGVMGSRKLWSWATLPGKLRRESARPGSDQPIVIGSPEVQASFAIAYEELKPGTAQGYRLLGLAPSATMSVALARALVCADSSEAEDIIDQLLEQQLLQIGGEATLRMHDLLWDHARRLLAAEHDQRTRLDAIARMTAWSLGQFRDHYPDRLKRGLSQIPALALHGKLVGLPLRDTYVRQKLTGPGSQDADDCRFFHADIMDLPDLDWPGTGSGRPDLDWPDAGLSGETKRLVLVAPGGAGKTTMAWHLCLLAADDPARAGQSPVVVLLRDFRPGAAHVDLESLIMATLRDRYETELVPEALADLLAQGRIALVADGLDEIVDPALRQEVIDSITGFAGRYPHVPILVTTRPFAAVQEVFPDFAVVTITPWDGRQAAEYLAKLAAARNESLIVAELTDPLERRADRGAVWTPLGLQMLLNWRLEEGPTDVPGTFTMLMERLIDEVVPQRDVVRGIVARPAASAGGRDRRSAEQVAFAMQSSAVNRISITQEEAPKLLGEAGIEHFEDAQEWLASARVGLMSQIERTAAGEAIYAFVHTAYREHLAASYLARLPVAAILDVMSAHVADPWVSVFVTAIQLRHMRTGQPFLQAVTEENLPLEPELRAAIWSWAEQAG